MITYSRIGAGNILLKVANMRDEQSFVLYPYTGGDHLLLQSSKRMIELNLRNGWFRINSRNEQAGARSYHLAMGSITGQMPDAALEAIREHLKRSAGMQGNSVLKWTNATYN